jgi:hypothetical protein
MTFQTQGFGLLPWGRFAWGFGGVVITRAIEIADCGDWLAAFSCLTRWAYQQPDTGSGGCGHPHCPSYPDGLKKESIIRLRRIILSIRSRSDVRRWILPSRLDPVWNEAIPGRLGTAASAALTGSGAMLSSRSTV